jgi:hypothetical protein
VSDGDSTEEARTMGPALNLTLLPKNHVSYGRSTFGLRTDRCQEMESQP